MDTVAQQRRMWRDLKTVVVFANTSAPVGLGLVTGLVYRSQLTL